MGLRKQSIQRILQETINKLPKNIYNFVYRYLKNNTLANPTNWFLWLSNFCHTRQTLSHVVSSCSVFLREGRYTRRHNSLLLNTANWIRWNENISLYVDLFMFESPYIIISIHLPIQDNQRSSMIARIIAISGFWNYLWDLKLIWLIPLMRKTYDIMIEICWLSVLKHHIET